MKIATNFIGFLEGREPSIDLINEFCDTSTKRSIIKYFLIANDIHLEKPKEVKDYTESDYPEITNFLKYKAFTSCGGLTIKDYRTKLENYYREYNELTEDNVRKFLGNEKVTVKATYIDLFKQYARFYKKEFNLPLKKQDIQIAKNESIKVKVLNSQEIKKLEKYIEGLDTKDHDEYLIKTIFTVYMYTGCRVSELYNKKFSDIDFEEKIINVVGKGNKPRDVPLNVTPKLMKFLRNHKKRYKEQLKQQDLPLIINRNYQNVSISTIQRKVKEVFKELGFDDDKSIHSLRHSFGTILANNNVPIDIIREVLGHSDIKTTQIYVDLSQQLRRKIRGKFKV